MLIILYGLLMQYKNVFAASMSSGLLYSLITMPFESAKNRMAAQKPGPDVRARACRGRQPVLVSG